MPPLLKGNYPLPPFLKGGGAADLPRRWVSICRAGGFQLAAPVGFNLPRRWVSTCFTPRRPARLAGFPLLKAGGSLKFKGSNQNTNFQTVAPAFFFAAGAVFSLCTALPLCCERGSFSLCAAAVLRLFAARAAGLRARIFHRVRAIFKLCAKYKI